MKKKFVYGRKIVYLDMDGVLADYLGHAKELNIDPKQAKLIPGFFEELKPIDGAIAAYEKLNKKYQVYILSTAPWRNPAAWMEKLNWIKKYLPLAYKNVILTHHKDLNIGDFLIDDTKWNGANQFIGEHIHFGSEKFPNWESVLNYLETN